MTAIVLCRIDASKRMHRFYRFDVEPDLFGNGALLGNGAASAAPARRAPSPSPPLRKPKPRLRANAASRNDEDIRFRRVNVWAQRWLRREYPNDSCPNKVSSPSASLWKWQ
jgi:hypothetical protein